MENSVLGPHWEWNANMSRRKAVWTSVSNRASGGISTGFTLPQPTGPRVYPSYAAVPDSLALPHGPPPGLVPRFVRTLWCKKIESPIASLPLPPAPRFVRITKQQPVYLPHGDIISTESPGPCEARVSRPWGWWCPGRVYRPLGRLKIPVKITTSESES